MEMLLCVVLYCLIGSRGCHHDMLEKEMPVEDVKMISLGHRGLSGSSELCQTSNSISFRAGKLSVPQYLLCLQCFSDNFPLG